jgi:hypothetical protein
MRSCYSLAPRPRDFKGIESSAVRGGYWNVDGGGAPRDLPEDRLGVRDSEYAMHIGAILVRKSLRSERQIAISGLL